MIKRVFKTTALALTGMLLSATASYSEKFPPGFKLQQVAPFDKPVSMGFAPDGRIFVLEQEGFVRIYKNNQKLATPFVQLDSVFHAKEKGLLGVAFDPNFATNNYVYFYYTVRLQGNSVNSTPLSGTGDGSPVRNKIVRYTANGDVALANSKFTVLDLDIIPGYLTNFNHDGGTMHFGPDGKLYVATGENTLWCPCYNDIFRTNCNACGLPFPAKPSQDLSNFHGKMLRINPDGTAPTDNPFYNSSATTSIKKRYIYAIGLRNPFTFHFKDGTSDIYFNDVGSGDNGNAREEINKLTSLGGKNFGYPDAEGIVNNPNFVDPILAYPHRLRDGSPKFSITIPGTPGFGCGITGGVYHSSSNGNWPSAYKNKYFYMDFCDGWINTLDIDGDMSDRNFATSLAGNYTNNSGGGWGSIFLESAPNGDLYFLTRSQTSGVSGLYRIYYEPTITGIVIRSVNSSTQINTPGGSLTFTGTVTGQNSSGIIWSVTPQQTGIAINSDGVLRASQNGNGIYTVTGTAEGDATKKASIVVTVTGQLNVSVDLKVKGNAPAVINIPSGTLELSATAVPTTLGYTFRYSTSDPTIAIINTSTGVLTALGNGLVNITAEAIEVSGLSASITVTITGQTSTNVINVSTMGKNTLIYPNPNKGTFTIKTPTHLGEQVEIAVYNEMGQIVYSEYHKDFKSEKVLSLKKLSSSVYMLVVAGHKGLYREIFMIE